MNDFSGKLSFSWPADGRGESIDVAQHKRRAILFGYGLNYESDVAPMAKLSEDSGVTAPNGAFDGIIMARGAVQAPFSLFLGDSSTGKHRPVAFDSELGGNLKLARH